MINIIDKIIIIILGIFILLLLSKNIRKIIPKKTSKTIYILLILSLIICNLYYLPWPKTIFSFIPADIKDVIQSKQPQGVNENISPQFIAYLWTHKEQFRYPLFRDLSDRIYYRLYRLKYPKSPSIKIEQTFYSHIYYKDGGPNYSTIPVICMKNIGEKTAVIKNININIDSEIKHNYDKHSFERALPLALFPNEEVIFFYGQEIPPVKFISEVNIEYEDLDNIYHSASINKKEVLYDFNRRVY